MKELTSNVTISVKDRPYKKKAKVYTVYFGNSQFIEFQNIKTAKDFECMVIREATEFTRVANIVLSDLFSIYRKIWPSLEDRFCFGLNDSFMELMQLFDKVYSMENAEVFTWVYKILEKLVKIIQTLDKRLKLKKMYLELYNLLHTKSSLEAASVKIKIFKSQLR